MKADQILSKAAAHMLDRAATYDKPEGERSMGRAVQAFNAITGRDLSESEGWLLLQVLKDVRLFQREGYHADSAEDCVAYAALKAEAKSNLGPLQVECKAMEVNLDAMPPIVGISRDEYKRRQAAGIAKAIAEGRFKGKGVDTEKHALIERMLSQGVSWSKICAAVPCSRSTIKRVADALKNGDAGATGEKPWYPDDRHWIEVPDDCMESPLADGEKGSILYKSEREQRLHKNTFTVYGGGWWDYPWNHGERIVAYTTEAPHGC